MSLGSVVVAMSGGVDSSVAALLLKESGFSVVGVSMQVWDYRQNGGSSSRATCCSPDDFTDARRVASKINVPYYVFDFEDTFKKEVIDDFVSKYATGYTPNPCVECNRKVKFKELRHRARSFNANAVATGHYAQVRMDADGYRLLRGADSDKDQSYFLYALTQSELSQTLFPVGRYTKSEVRDIAREAGLVTAEKPESQDICFVSGSVSDFLVSIGGKRPAGKIVDRNNRELGDHDGIHQFTIGQRRGLNIGGSEQPLYVIGIDPNLQKITLGTKQDLERESFLVKECTWVSPSLQGELPNEFMSIVQVRHRHKGIPVRVMPLAGGVVKVQFVNDWTPISPGQSAVFYDTKNEEVLGGGIIER